MSDLLSDSFVAMADFQLTAQADLGLLFEITRAQYSAADWNRITRGVVGKNEFVEHCLASRFPSIGFTHRGKPIGGLIFDGNAAHLAVLPEYHGRWGILWKEALAWIFSNKDPILVDIDIGNHKCLRFMDRNNWPRVKTTEKHVTYEMSSKAEPHWRRRNG